MEETERKHDFGLAQSLEALTMSSHSPGPELTDPFHPITGVECVRFVGCNWGFFPGDIWAHTFSCILQIYLPGKFEGIS